MVMIQNRLLGLYYTTLHEYCEESGFPSPAPPMDDVIAHWNAAFAPVRSEVESISFIARGKAAHQPMSKTIDTTKSSIPPPNGPRRTPTGLISNPQPRTLRIPSTASLPEDEQPSPAPSFKRPDYSHATDFTTATMLGGGAVHRSLTTPSPATSTAADPSRRDYFASSTSSLSNPSLRTKTSNGSFNTNGLIRSTNTIASNGNGTFPLKKKPPPPPPPKRVPSTNDLFVVAQYAFAGQGSGDLSFREGDRIRVVKRTDTDQDWYVPTYLPTYLAF